MKEKDVIASIDSILNELETNEKLCRQHTNVPFVIRLSEIGQYHSDALTEIRDIVMKYKDEENKEKILRNALYQQSITRYKITKVM